MKKKELTINRLALGNLKQRRKQYTILIIGIILAMVFSSSTLFFISSTQETYIADQYKRLGNQDDIMTTAENSEEIFKKMVEADAIKDYGLAHIIGYGYSKEDEENLGTAIAWLDDKTKALSNITFIEGGYPENADEIAIEQTALIRLGLDAKIGDEVTLQFKIQSNEGYLDKAAEKTYTLVGIAADKRSNVKAYYENNMLPAAFVAQGTQTELGGKELLAAYIVENNDHVKERVLDGNTYVYKDGFMVLWLYLDEYSIEAEVVSTSKLIWDYDAISSISNNGRFIVFIVIVLILASCVAIINSFNTNLKERKKQIGMLRAVGATKRQIIKIFGREALIISFICTPISVAISYFLVRALITAINEEAVMTESVGVLIQCAVVNVIVTMLAAMIPLLATARITPMQAIRNIDAARKMKAKRIKTQRQFSVPSHLAKRNAQLYKGGKIAVSIILTVVILLSCYGFSALKVTKQNLHSYDYDYVITDYYHSPYSYVNTEMNGISEADKQDITLYPYFSNAVTQKKIEGMFETEEITDYHFLLSGPFSTYELMDGVGKEAIISEDEYYSEYKNRFGNGKDILPVPIYSYDDLWIKDFAGKLTAGKIDYDKLASGEEIILIAPQTVKLAFETHSSFSSWGNIYDDQSINNGAEIVMQAECPYSVGDKMKISVIEYKSEEAMEENPNNYSRVDREVTVGAIISPVEFGYEIDSIYEGFAILTDNSGMNFFSENAKYHSVKVNVASGIEIDDDIEKTVREYLEYYCNKYELVFYSQYTENLIQQNDYTSLYISMLSVIIIGFVVCASIVNNSLTATIRERKKEIGTLRAVGADIKVLVGAYIRQLLSMFGFGYGIGFGGFCISYFIVQKIIGSVDDDPYMVFSPWETVAFCAILFAICSINLWSKVRKEMKNSIVENIKEL